MKCAIDATRGPRGAPLSGGGIWLAQSVPRLRASAPDTSWSVFLPGLSSEAVFDTKTLKKKISPYVEELLLIFPPTQIFAISCSPALSLIHI